jgi:hypothetical protein
MTNKEKRAIARAIAVQVKPRERIGAYIRALSELGLKTNCCEEGVCGVSPRNTGLCK